MNRFKLKYSFIVLIVAVVAAACASLLENPEIYSIFPGRGPVGTQVTITGTRFGDMNEDDVALYFGGVTTPVENIVSWSDSKIVAIVPENAVTGKVVVEVDGKKSQENIVFQVLEFAPIDVSVSVAVALSDGTVSFIRSDRDRGLYIDPVYSFDLYVDGQRVNVDQLVPVRNTDYLLGSGWVDNGETIDYYLYAWREFADLITTPVAVAGPIIDGVQWAGKFYLLDYLDRSVEVFDPESWSITGEYQLAADMPFSHPFRIFYSSSTSSFVIFTRPIFDTQNGEMLVYSGDFQLEDTVPLPFMKVYDVFYSTPGTFVVAGIQGENSIYFAIPEEDPENMYSVILTYNDRSVAAGGFYPDPGNGGLIVSDPLSGNLLFYPYGGSNGKMVINPDYGGEISSPTVVRTIPDFDYIFVKSGGNRIAVVDSFIGAIYGVFPFPASVVDMEAGIEGGK